MCPKAFCATFYISLSLFCRKSVQRWMRRFWAKKCRRDHLRSLWRSVMLVTVRRWQRSAAAEGRWGSLTKCGVTKLVTARRVYDGSSWSSEKWSQYPDSKSWSVLERRPSTDRCAYEGPSYFPSRGMKIEAEEIAQVWDDWVHDGPSWPRRSVVTTTVRHEVRRPSRVLADFQQLESLFN